LKELPRNFGLKRLKAALSHVKGSRVAIDIGAHKGIWTRVMMERFESVYSFEPVKDNFDTLKNINPHSYKVALGNHNGCGGMLPGNNTGMWHLTETDAKITTKIEELDSYAIDDVDFIKIDVEGYELHVLKGAEETIKKCRPDILLEENGLLTRYGVTPTDLWWHMESIGYENVGRFQDDYLWSSTKN